ncbi:MAG: hypothetical protein A2505_05140 [Deltaproteobacteria bacterium RIFOXYD12_FULL_55_16]|nr:MAG: hypothetical protein A2505_05140 [Deltaproteobacteria bacterium RIFOXYD12_FULL_55_16]
MTKPQAKTILETAQEGHETADLVTKQYLATSLAETKLDIIRWVAGLLIAQAAIVAALVKLP